MILSFVTNTCHIEKNCCYFMSVMCVNNCDCFFVFSREKINLFKKLIIFVETMNFRNFSSKFASFERIAKVYFNWNYNKLLLCVNLVNLRSQNKSAKRCRAFQLIVKFIELNSYKRSKYHNSMRNRWIWIIFASLNFAQLILQLTSLKFTIIYDN